MATDTATRTRPRRPWPGPIPYEEADRHVFRGRSREISEIIQRLERGRLVYVSAASGVGKTSVLRAGVVPRLRARRAEFGVGEGRSRFGAVLVVRDWLSPMRPGTRDVLRDAVERAVGALVPGAPGGATHQGRSVLEAYAPGGTDRPGSDGAVADSIRADAAALLAVPVAGNGAEYVAELEDAAGGLVLVLDQFEEALQGTEEQIERIQRQIALIFTDLANTRMLLSFRREFLGDLGTLEANIDSKGRRYDLPRISVTALRDEVLASEWEVGSARVSLSRAPGVGKNPAAAPKDAVGKLMSWLGMHSAYDAGELERSAASTERASAKLLKLQAVLLELHDRLRRRDDLRRGERYEITGEDLDALLEEANAVDDQGQLSGIRFMDMALPRFIERRVLPVPEEFGGPPPIDDETDDEAGQPERRWEPFRSLQHRRAAARMAEFLSSGGRKVQQYEGPLVGRMWRMEWQVLNATAERVESALREAAVGQVHAVELGRALGIENRKYGPKDGVLSGRSRQERWTRWEVIDDLLAVARETLQRLADGNIVRPKQSPEGLAYELVHDGFGSAFYAWAEANRDRPLDALASTTAHRGMGYEWQDMPHAIIEACWLGCWIGPRDFSTLVTFRGVRFERCDLRGTLFVKCQFSDCEFVECDLDGVIFRSCRFERTKFSGNNANGLTFLGGSLATVSFVRGPEHPSDASESGPTSQPSDLYKMLWMGAFEGGEAVPLVCDDIWIEDSLLYQWTVGSVDLRGPLRIARSRLEFADLRELGINSSRQPDGQQITIEDCDIAFSWLSPAVHAAIARAPSQGQVVFTGTSADVTLPRKQLDYWAAPQASESGRS